MERHDGTDVTEGPGRPEHHGPGDAPEREEGEWRAKPKNPTLWISSFFEMKKPLGIRAYDFFIYQLGVIWQAGHPCVVARFLFLFQ